MGLPSFLYYFFVKYVLRPNYLFVCSLQTDFAIMLAECEMVDGDQNFLRNAGITTFAKLAFACWRKKTCKKI